MLSRISCEPVTHQENTNLIVVLHEYTITTNHNNDRESVMELYIIRYYKNKHTSTWTLLLFHALTAGAANRCGVITASVRYKQLIHIDIVII